MHALRKFRVKSLLIVSLTSLTSLGFGQSYWDAQNPGVPGFATVAGTLGGIAEPGIVARDGTVYAIGTSTGGMGTEIYSWDKCAGWSGFVGVGSGSFTTLYIDGANLYIGGSFTSLDTTPNDSTETLVNATNIAVYNLCSGICSRVGDAAIFQNNEVTAIVADTNHTVYIGTKSSTEGDTNLLMVLEDGNWSKVGGGLTYHDEGEYSTGVTALAADRTDIYAGGCFIGGTNSNGSFEASTNFIKWSGTSNAWMKMNPFPLDYFHNISSIVVSGTNVFVAKFVTEGPPYGLAVFSTDGTYLPSGNTLVTDDAGGGCGDAADGRSLVKQNGVVYVGGIFQMITEFATCDGTVYNGIAAWTNGAWQPLGEGVGADGEIYALAADSQSIYVFGYFDTAGGDPADNGARWVTGGSPDPCTSIGLGSVSATACGNTVTLSWTEDGLQTNTILSSTTSGGPYTYLGTTTNTSFTNTGLSSDTTYYYVIEAEASDCVEASSSEVNVTTGLALYNVQFYHGSSPQTGPAAIGNSSSDYWTQFSCDCDTTYSETITNSCGNPSSLIIEVGSDESEPITGQFSTEYPTTPLWDYGIWTPDGGTFFINLIVPAGTYDVYFYSVTPYYSRDQYVGGTFTLASGASNISDYSPLTASASSYTSGTYTDGAEYVVFDNVEVPSGGTLEFTVSGPVPFANGLQIYQH
ncbi:MAG TPA: hypothetical protein VH619_06730 [Verrucomicrobiae bacterium]|jgi:hypothetical protein|nr:hypothetical protein [Verrucomicrobiae bacterium]